MVIEPLTTSGLVILCLIMVVIIAIMGTVGTLFDKWLKKRKDKKE